MYVLDEPSIGLHPANITGLTGVMQDLIHDGNSVILVGAAGRKKQNRIDFFVLYFVQLRIAKVKTSLLGPIDST